jgi:hypothetical protein
MYSSIDWEAIHNNGNFGWRCILCQDGRIIPYDKTHWHETSGAHMALAELQERQERLDVEELAEAGSMQAALPPYLGLIDSST